MNFQRQEQLPVAAFCFVFLRVFDGKLFMYKKCSKCKEEKLFSEFNRNKSKKDGYNFNCNSCRRDYYLKNKEQLKIKRINYYAANEEEIVERLKKYREVNKEKISNSKARYRENNKKQIAEKQAKYRLDNRDRLANYQANYQKTNRAKINSMNAKRRATKLRATPKWLTAEDYIKIQELYEIAQAFKLYTGQEYHVDHIVPLQGKNVCGLHVPWNLQILTASENLCKHNKVIEN